IGYNSSNNYFTQRRKGDRFCLDSSLRLCVLFAPLREISSLVIRILRQCQAEIAIVQMDHQVFCDKLLEGCIEPRSVVELRRDIFTTASVGTVLIKIGVQIRIG